MIGSPHHFMLIASFEISWFDRPAGVSKMLCSSFFLWYGLNRMLMLTGTLFVLMKDPSPKQQLLDAVASQSKTNEEVQELIQQLQSQNPERRPAASSKTQGKWRLLWSMQVRQRFQLLVSHDSKALNT